MPSDRSVGGTGRIVEVPEQELYELYSTLADATSAAATGNKNGCAKHAAEAKRHALELHEECNIRADTDHTEEADD